MPDSSSLDLTNYRARLAPWKAKWGGTRDGAEIVYMMSRLIDEVEQLQEEIEHRDYRNRQYAEKSY